MKSFRIAGLLAALLFAVAATAQVPEQLDYALELLAGGLPTPGGDVVYAIVVTADWWTQAQTPFVVRMTVPHGIEPVSRCTGELEFDTATRVLTWSDHLDNPVIALNSCPLVFHVDSSLPPGSAVVLEATLSPSAPDRNLSNNVARHTSVVMAASDLELTASADLLRYKPDTVVTYTFELTNHGPQDAYDVALNGELSPYLGALSFEQTSGPAAILSGVSASLPRLGAGEKATFRLAARAKTGVEAATVGHRVTARSSSVDLNERNNEASVWTYVGPDADLAVASAKDPAPPSTRMFVTVHVTNSGPDTVNNATALHFLDTIDWQWDFVEKARIVSVNTSHGTCSAPEIHYPFAELPPPALWVVDCSLGTLAPGADVTIAIELERTPGTATMRLTSVLNPMQNDPRPGNNVRSLVIEEVPARRRAVRQ